MNRREATAALGVLPLGAAAQPRTRPYRIGFLGLSSAADYAPSLDAFRQGLRELGYQEGRNLVIEYRWAEGREERLAGLAAELVRLNPEVLVTHATGVRAVQQATSTIPIVMGASADPVGLGLIKSLASPGGNTTGVASQIFDLAAKRLQLLKEAVPKLDSVAVLLLTTSPGADRGLEETQAAARTLGVRVLPVMLAGESKALEAAIASVARERPGGIIVQPAPVTGRYNARIAELALKHGLPTMGGGKYFAVAGGLMAYGSDFGEGWRLAARYVDRILKGATPADLPVEQPTRFELVINLKTAKALNLVVPGSLLLRATEVIE